MYKSLEEICEMTTKEGKPFWKIVQEDDCKEQGTVSYTHLGGFIGSSGYSDLRILNNLFSWIISMGTNCDRVYKVGLIFCCIHSFYSLIYKNFIGWPASTWCVLGNVH